ncbi:hypothetical protein [Emticicia sp. 21SJ11W-3]|uniref:hypothetical protein n=1 Tax=Emticicia sp. 21SJ11W-3 TaxID=2916755 RepID=UPI00209E0981|nr:hypothetical protein [Emticicia sp. 21SJ11W-3]UTA68699.1 hypothetical protein MB380_02580 [Emticicia sp. 21SJ11W-3]
MKKKWFNIIGISFLIIICVIGYTQLLNLEKRKKIAIGTITGTKLIRGLYITYSYKIDSEIYSGLTTAYGISNSNIYKYLVGKKFPIVYDSLDYYQSHILILENEFKSLKLDYPDSLKWVCDSLKLKDCK